MSEKSLDNNSSRVTMAPPISTTLFGEVFGPKSITRTGDSGGSVESGVSGIPVRSIITGVSGGPVKSITDTSSVLRSVGSIRGARGAGGGVVGFSIRGGGENNTRDSKFSISD